MDEEKEKAVPLETPGPKQERNRLQNLAHKALEQKREEGGAKKTSLLPAAVLDAVTVINKKKSQQAAVVATPAAPDAVFTEQMVRGRTIQVKSVDDGTSIVKLDGKDPFSREILETYIIARGAGNKDSFNAYVTKYLYTKGALSGKDVIVELTGDFKNLSLAGGDFSGSRFINAEFDEVDFASANLRGSTLENVRFVRCNMVNADLRHTDMKAIEFFGYGREDAVVNDRGKGRLTGMKLSFLDPNKLQDLGVFTATDSGDLVRLQGRLDEKYQKLERVEIDTLRKTVRSKRSWGQAAWSAVAGWSYPIDSEIPPERVEAIRTKLQREKTEELKKEQPKAYIRLGETATLDPTLPFSATAEEAAKRVTHIQATRADVEAYLAREILTGEDNQSFTQFMCARRSITEDPKIRYVVGFEPGTDLDRLDFSNGLTSRHRDFSQVNFAYTTLRNANFKNGMLHGTCFEGATIDSAIFDDADMREGNMNAVVANNKAASFIRTKLQHGQLDASTLPRCDFKQANLEGVFARNADFHNASFIKTKMMRMRLRHANLQKTTLTGADMTEADIDHTTNLLKVVGGATVKGMPIQEEIERQEAKAETRKATAVPLPPPKGLMDFVKELQNSTAAKMKSRYPAPKLGKECEMRLQCQRRGLQLLNTAIVGAPSWWFGGNIGAAVATGAGMVAAEGALKLFQNENGYIDNAIGDRLAELGAMAAVGGNALVKGWVGAHAQRGILHLATGGVQQRIAGMVGGDLFNYMRLDNLHIAGNAAWWGAENVKNAWHALYENTTTPEAIYMDATRSLGFIMGVLNKLNSREGHIGAMVGVGLVATASIVLCITIPPAIPLILGMAAPLAILGGGMGAAVGAFAGPTMDLMKSYGDIALSKCKEWMGKVRGGERIAVADVTVAAPEVVSVASVKRLDLKTPEVANDTERSGSKKWVDACKAKCKKMLHLS